MNAQQLDAAVKAEMLLHTSEHMRPGAYGRLAELPRHCQRCGDLWPCQYVIQASITLKLSAIANILAADQAAIIEGVVSNGQTTRQGEGRRRQ